MSAKDTTDSQREEPVGIAKTFAFSARPLRGLTEREATERRARGLGNDAKVGTGRTYLQILRENVFTFFNIVLFSLASILLLLGSPRDAFFTGVVALFNVSLATFQEIRAKRKLDRIALLTRPTATVLREEVEKVIDPNQVVTGDLVVAGPGDQIIVDGTVVGDSEAEVDESLLTGEADPVPKRAGDAVSSGSFVISGRVVYEAEQVGGNSFAARLTESARAHKSELTPLQQEVNLVIRVLLAVVFFFGLLIALNLFLSTDVSLVDSVRAASVVFGLTPSSLFLTIVVAYAIGAVRIAGQGALVQRSNAIESLTHVSVLCLDKTGTLTSNRIKFERLVPLGEGPDLPGAQHLRAILGIYARSCTAGNRTSEAIVAALPGQPEQPVAEVLFASDRKWSALAFEGETLRGLYTLGAPEVLIPHLADQRRDLDAEIGLWSAQGLRVLLFAGLPTVMPLHDAQGVPQLPEGLIPLGLLVLSDELRPDARETLAGFAEAGIRLKIISGDNPHTVEALARQAGMAADGAPLVLRSGQELAMLDEAGFQAAVRETTIFGRITPEQKQRIVRTLREQGEYVAMTGDGVNDVLALKQARLGIAMQSGSQAARSVADIILLND
ncbi:MAG: HAD-IC family P-type ATPase, partial [Caldilineaceae bacterium]|nr:HAD-IC family P-type ATPase [Caldilineaceae bacterium]